MGSRKPYDPIQRVAGRNRIKVDLRIRIQSDYDSIRGRDDHWCGLRRYFGQYRGGSRRRRRWHRRGVSAGRRRNRGIQQQTVFADQLPGWRAQIDEKSNHGFAYRLGRAQEQNRVTLLVLTHGQRDGRKIGAAVKSTALEYLRIGD